MTIYVGPGTSAIPVELPDLAPLPAGTLLTLMGIYEDCMTEGGLLSPELHFKPGNRTLNGLCICLKGGRIDSIWSPAGETHLAHKPCTQVNFLQFRLRVTLRHLSVDEQLGDCPFALAPKDLPVHPYYATHKVVTIDGGELPKVALPPWNERNVVS